MISVPVRSIRSSRPVPEFHAVDPRQRDVDARPGQQPVPEHHPPVGDDEMRCPPIQERPDRQPPDDHQPDDADDQQHDRSWRWDPSSVVIDVAGAERRQRGSHQQDQHGADQPLPVRVPVQNHPLVCGQHILGVSHAETVPSRRRPRVANAQCRPQQRSLYPCRCRCAAAHVVDRDGGALDLGPPAKGADARPYRYAAGAIAVDQRCACTAGIPPTADPQCQLDKKCRTSSFRSTVAPSADSDVAPGSPISSGCSVTLSPIPRRRSAVGTLPPRGCRQACLRLRSHHWATSTPP